MPSFCPCFKTKCDKFDKFNFAIPCNSEFPQFLQKLAINVATFGRDLANMLTEKELHCHLPFSRGYPLTSSRVRAASGEAPASAWIDTGRGPATKSARSARRKESQSSGGTRAPETSENVCMYRSPSVFTV